MDERVPPPGGRLVGDSDYTKDIEEIHYGASTSEDDEDEPRLTIDTSEDEEEDGMVENSSSSSSFSRRRKPSSTSRLKIHPAVHRGAPATSKFNTNPLHSLQQLVHSPFLNAQISAANGGINQGCKITPLTKDNRSKSIHDTKYSPENAQLAAAAEALRKAFGYKPADSNDYDLLTTSKSAATSGSTTNSVAKSKKSSNAAKRNNTNFQRLSPVSIEVVPSLSHLLPLSQHSPPSPQTPQPSFAEKCDSNVRSTNSNRLNYIVSKLQRSATEEEHLRQLQQLQSSPEAENFKMFQQFLKSGQFQARCNNNNLEILPATSSPSNQSSSMINLSNSKGFRYVSSNAQTRPTFGGLPPSSLPPPPPLTFKSTPNERMDFRMPPTLTVIPKNSTGGSKKSSFRRSPPPMVPIESIANFRKPLNEDNVVYRLKKLGTDIELEKNTAASRDDQAAVEELAAAAKASVTNNSNSDKASLPFLKPIPIGERLPNDLKNNALSKLHPPPPSLIPIKPISQFVPILPSPVTQSTISEVPIKMRKSTGARLPPSLTSKPGRNSGSCEVIDGSQMMFGKGSNDVISGREDMADGNLPIMTANPALDFSQHSPITQSTINEVPIKLKKSTAGRLPPSLQAKPGRSGGCEIVDGGQMMFGRGSPNDVILPSREDMAGNVPILTAKPAVDLSHLYSRFIASMAASSKVTKKKRRRLSTKSEYTKLAHALVQAATPLPPKKDDDRPVIVPTRNETSPKEFELCDSEREIITIEPILMPGSRYESEEEDAPNGYDFPPVQEDEYVHVPDNSSPPPEFAAPTLPPPVTSSQQNGAVDDSNYFMFNPSQAIQLGVLPNGRKMLSCDVCSGVYHKMFSLKKHYYRNHINPKFISAKHTDMFKLEPTSQALLSNPKFHTSMYWCNICDCLFDEKHELSSHLTDHPPLALENSNNSQLFMCPTCNMVFSKKRTQDRHSKKCAKLSTKSVDVSSTPAKVQESTPNSGDEEGPYDNAAEETNSTTSSKNNDDALELDEMSKNSKLETSMMCLFCELSFTDTTKRKKHVLQHHHPKRKHQPCVYCKNKTFSDLSDLLKHICEMHSKRYFGCAICKIRFRTKEDLVAHNAESHESEIAEVEKEPVVEEKVKPPTISNKNGKNYKCNQCTKVFINTVELGRHRKTAHRDSSRNNIKKVVSAFSGPVDSNEQKYRSTIITTADYETEFYRNVCHNVKYNLENCMEGCIEMQKEENSNLDVANDPRYASAPGITEIGEEKSASLSFHDLYGTENIDSRFIQNVSRLHLATQLTMLKKANLLDKEIGAPLRTKTGGGKNSTIASRLALAEKSDGERADNEAKNENVFTEAANEIVFTGEWIRARNYICGTCFARFNNFWDMEDHRWSRHPNVYGFYYEFVTEQAPGSNWAMKRTLQHHGALGLPINHAIPSSSTCTKCQKVITPVSEFHKHILECGGDTTWMSMMFAAHTKRNKKWRPYGSRRRKNIARHRGLKRNIPTTPVKIIGPPRNRQKAGDTETIQRMIANLPPKRITRRVITFDDLEAKPKGRFSNNPNSQSNILTRKRKESMEVRNATTSRSQQLQQDSNQSVTTSKTLMGTKNNTPYNNASTSTSRSRHEQIKSNTAASKESDSKLASIAVESKPDHVRLRSEDVAEMTTRSASISAKTKPAEIETEIKEELPEPEVSPIKITLKSNKTAKSIPAKDTGSSSSESATSVTTSNRNESDSKAKPALPSKSSKASTSKTDSIAERESSPETISPPKTRSASAEESTTPAALTVVKITTQSKNHVSANKTRPDADPEPVPIRKLRSSDDSNFTHSESISESKKNSSRDEQVKTEPKSTAEVSTTLELRSGTGLRNKPLIIKIQSENKQKNSSNDQPVTIIRSDKKKRRRCTPVTSRRLTPEIIPPSKSSTVDVEETKDSSLTLKDVPAESPKPVVVTEEVEKLPSETRPIEVTEKLEDTTVETENLVPEVISDKDSIVTSEKSDFEMTTDVSDDSATSEKSVSEIETEISKDSIISSDTSIDETTLPVESKEPEDTRVKLEKFVFESVPVLEPVTTDEELEQSSSSIEKSTLESPIIETEIKDESVSNESDTENETDPKEDPVNTVDIIPTASVNSTTTESQTEPTNSTVEPESISSKPASEPEEGEIDLSTIEPADQDSPALPDTSVILAAMKETMRQTDAVISSMPAAVNSSKKRKREDITKCKKCGVKMETSTNTAPVCDNCTEIPAKKPKPAPPTPPPPPKIETFDCKVCHVSVPKKICGGNNDELCDKCIASANAMTAAAAVAANAAAVACAATAIKMDKPAAKKCSSKIKETRIQPPPPFRCRKCDSIGLAPPDGSTVCEKCSRLQETVCLLCKSSYISDTNDKVCGKCMLAGSSKQKKRIVDNDSTPTIVTSTVGSSDTVEKKSPHCDVCKNAPKVCTCKRRSSGQPERAEVACDKCGKLWRDDENSGSSVCRTCRLVPFENKICKTPVKINAPKVVTEHSDSIRCLDCSIVVVPTLAEAISRKLCDGCSMRRDERRSSNEIRYMDTVNAVARGGLTVQRSPNVFSGFATAADDAARTKLEDMRVEHRKEEERSVPVVGSGPPGASTAEHKTPMKNVKLICRGCYGVFDTVSSYKYHCDNCKHRNNEKKPLLSFAKRNTKGGPESTTQPEPANGASFEILEGVQIKYVEMGGGSQSDKAEAGKEPSQIPLVVYESDSSPMKKSDSSRSVKKVKRAHSSPETIMDTIESVIKSICYDTPETCSESDDRTPASEGTSTETTVQQQLAISEDPSNVSIENLKPEPKDGDGDDQHDAQPVKKPSSRSRSSKKKASRKRRPASKKARKLDLDEAPSAADKTDIESENAVKNEPIETPGKAVDEAKTSSSPSSRSRDRTKSKNSRRSRRRTCTSTAPPGRALRSRTKFYENLSDFKTVETDETPPSPVPESEPMEVVEPEPASPPPVVPSVEDVEKPAAPPKAVPKKRRSELSKSTAKKPRTDTNNDLGFAVTKTNKTIPKNVKKASIDSKNVDQLDDHVVESASAPSSSTNQFFVPNETPIEPRKTSTCFEPVAVPVLPVVPVEIVIETKRRRSSELSAVSSIGYDQESKYSSPLHLPVNESLSRRDSSITIASSTGDFQNELGRSFFDDGHGLESGSEYTEGSSSKNPTPTSGLEELNGSGSFPEPGEGQDSAGQTTNSWYTTAWDFFGQKSLGSIIDTMNEILSRPEVSSCSSDSVDLFREQMMMFQHFGGEMSAIDKQEEESKQDEETTTFIDLDDISGRIDTKAKSKTSSSASCSNPNVFNLDCLICDRTFCNRSGLQSHMLNIHGNEGMSKNFKDNKSKQNKANQNGMKTSKHKCSHCQKVLYSKAETLLHMKEHWKTFALSKNSDNGSHLKNSITDKLEELLLDKALMNYLKSPQETQHRNNLPLKILNQISLAKKTQFTNWKSALAQMLDMDPNAPPATTATDPPSPVEPPVAPVEPNLAEQKNSQGTETPNPEEEIDGFPCPMCDKTFEYTRQRNTHLIMVHAPRQSTHKHLLDGKSSSKKGEKIKSMNENCDNKVGKESAREKIFHSYLLNDSVNTVIKKESLDDSYSAAKPPNRPATSSATDVSFNPAKKPEKRPLAVKTEALPYPSCSTSTSMDFATSTSVPSTTTKITAPNPTSSVAVKPPGNDDQQSAAKKKKPCRKKMSKKEMNLPAAIVKMKAEQALLQLCNSRFNRICSQ